MYEGVSDSFTYGEAQTGEITINLGVPSMRCLFEIVQCSLESAHMRLLIECLTRNCFTRYLG